MKLLETREVGFKDEMSTYQMLWCSLAGFGLTIWWSESKASDFLSLFFFLSVLAPVVSASSDKCFNMTRLNTWSSVSQQGWGQWSSFHLVTFCLLISFANQAAVIFSRTLTQMLFLNELNGLWWFTHKESSPSLFFLAIWSLLQLVLLLFCFSLCSIHTQGYLQTQTADFLLLKSFNKSAKWPNVTQREKKKRMLVM